MRAFVLITVTAVAMTSTIAFAQAPFPGAAPDHVAQSGAPADAGALPKGASAASPAGQYVSSDTLGDASKLKAGDANVVSNGPVPDTPDARAQYGRPLSDAGKRTAPNGD